MTTTELIEILKKNEHGAVTGQERLLWFDFKLTLDDGTEVELFDVAEIKCTGGGDGIGGASLHLEIKN